jgi:hypothetical protein
MRRDQRGWARIANLLPDDRTEKVWRDALARGVPIESPQGLFYDGTVGASVKLFEVVRGAHLVGRAPPGATVEARLALFAEAGEHAFEYHRSTTADASGRFDLVVAYPSAGQGDATDVVARGPYALHVVGGGDASAAVGVAQVRSGTRIEVAFAP